MAVARAAHPALHALAARDARPRLRRDDERRLRPPLALVVRRPARRSGSRSGTTSRSPRRRRTHTRAGRGEDARRASGSPARRSTTPRRSSATPTRRTPPATRRSSFATRRCSSKAARRRSPGRSCAARSARFAAALDAMGVGPGDRVAAFLPNVPQTAVAFLACASLGAIWSICSADMGPLAVLDRFRQIEPKVLVACDGYRYGGVAHDRTACCARWSSELPSVRDVVVAGAASIADADARRARPRRAPRPRLRRARRRRRRRSRRARCRSTIRSGSSTRAARPACRSRSSTATAA